MTDGPMEALAGQRVLVTGGAGVIARELLDRLSTAGASVLSVDRLPLSGDPPPGVEHLVADLAFADLEPIARFRPRHVFHLAATFERSVESPEFWDQNWNDNVVVTHRLAELAGRIGAVESFVFASSYLVYDPEQYSTAAPPTAAVPLAESSRLGSRNLCGAAKLYGEAELRFVREVQAAGFRASFARIFRVYGRGSRDVVSRWVRAALDGEPIAVYHAENRFDYIFSGDVAEGLVRMAVSPDATGIINLGSGNARPVAAVIEAIERATGSRLDARYDAVDEPFEASCADVGRLRDTLDWTPPTTLEAGVEWLVDFERRRRGEGAPVAADR
jgi:carbamoyl-phosphate synthase large subunit